MGNSCTSSIVMVSLFTAEGESSSIECLVNAATMWNKHEGKELFLSLLPIPWLRLCLLWYVEISVNATDKYTHFQVPNRSQVTQRDCQKSPGPEKAAGIKRHFSFKTSTFPTGCWAQKVAIKPVDDGSEVNKVPEVKIENYWLPGWEPRVTQSWLYNCNWADKSICIAMERWS